MEKEKLPLHLEYRPQSFDEYIGNKKLIDTLKSVINRTQTYLFYGSRGCGKTSLARLIAKELKINQADIYEMDGASNTSVDDARKLKSTIYFKPLSSNKKIYIIDECHRLSGNAMDALLKALEEPPKHCIFVLCTTEFTKVPKTIKSRSKMFEVLPLNKNDAFELIDWICSEEKIKLNDEVIDAIIDKCEGIPREIIIKVDTVRDVKDVDSAIGMIQSLEDNAAVKDLCRALLKKEKWEKIAAILKDLQEDPEEIRYAVLGYMHAVMMKGDNKQAILIIDAFLNSFMYSKRAGLDYACYQSIMS